MATNKKKADYELVRAALNLHAIFQNFEELVRYDKLAADLITDQNITIQFIVRSGPEGYIDISHGRCRVGRGRISRPKVKLYFVTPAHFNKMVDDAAIPLMFKGFTRMGFLKHEFNELARRLEFFLKPESGRLLEDKKFLALNTRLMLNTAVFAVREIGTHDPDGRLIVPNIGNGSVNLSVLPDGPSAHVNFADGRIEAGKGKAADPMAGLTMKNLETANRFLNKKLDLFAALGSGDIVISGQIPMLEWMDLLLDRVEKYLT